MATLGKPKLYKYQLGRATQGAADLHWKMIRVKLLTDDNQVQITAYRDLGVAKTQVNGREIYFYNERSMRTDCHGLTFTEGKYWIDNDQVDTILKHDSYKELNPSDRVRVGDVAVYR